MNSSVYHSLYKLNVRNPYDHIFLSSPNTCIKVVYNRIYIRKMMSHIHWHCSKNGKCTAEDTVLKFVLCQAPYLFKQFFEETVS